MKPLTLLQRQRITLSLFFTVAVGAVFTVATPAFVPWKVVDDKRTQALDQQRRQGKDFHVIENRGRSRGGSNSSDDHETDSATSSTTHHHSSSISSQGPLVSLLTDRSQQQHAVSSRVSAATTASSPASEDSESIDPEQASTTTTTKKRRRRRKRKMVNEGWQEFTGRTAREEKEKQHTLTEPAVASEPVLGENGGQEISWKNKSQ
ncbi:hypothetical protein BGX23_000894 [Mortierella sp. AD031]|nr:hypothetical protein BGX23_000894 [Mortierella sp. AD031]